MAAIDYLTQRGLAAKRKGSRVLISPRAKVTEDVRKYVQAHRLELLAELAANDGIERRTHWRVTLDGKVISRMKCDPMTYEEALAAARYHWPKAEVSNGQH